MLSFMRAQYTLFQQGYNILDEIDPYMKKLAAQVRAKECRLMGFDVSYIYIKKCLTLSNGT